MTIRTLARRSGVVMLTAACLTLLALAAPRAGAQQVYRGGVVACDHPLASEAGREILEQGGNAVDAAVAAAFALSVVRPYSCGIGGGGFLVGAGPCEGKSPGEAASDPGSCKAWGLSLDHREYAPAAVGPNHFVDLDDPAASRWSGHAVGVPTSVGGLAFAADAMGTMDLAALLQPAIRLAEEGFPADEHYVRAARSVAAWIEAEPQRTRTHERLWTHFLKEGRVEVGEVIRLPGQAQALRLIARDGVDAFYEGPIAEAIAEAVREAGGVMTEADLAGVVDEEFPGAYTMRPWTNFSAFGRSFVTLGPPSAGGVAVVEIIGLLRAWEEATGGSLKELGHNSAEYVHVLAEAMKHAFADRARWMGDPQFVEVPWREALDERRLESVARSIDMQFTKAPEDYGVIAPPPEDAGTSHLSVVDSMGNAVSLTQTINLSFGSRILVEPYDFFLNNEMDDFTTDPRRPNAFGLRQSEANLPAPSKRPISSMAPILVADPETRAVEMVAGASGGPRIISSTVQTLLNAIIFDMGAEEAVSAPRIHHQWLPDVLVLEPAWSLAAPEGQMGIAELQEMMRRVERVNRFRNALESKGHRLGQTDAIGVVQFIRRRGEGFQAASDPRKGGAPAGLVEPPVEPGVEQGAGSN